MDYLMIIISGLFLGFVEANGWKGYAAFLPAIIVGTLIKYLTK